MPLAKTLYGYGRRSVQSIASRDIRRHNDQSIDGRNTRRRSNQSIADQDTAVDQGEELCA
jgi:hypothetical protein